MRIIQNEPYYLEVFITKIGKPYHGSGVPGLVINYELYKSSDNSLLESGLMDDIGEGVYQKQITLSNLGQYRIIYKTPNKYEDGIESLLVIEEITDDLSGITTKLNRLLGLAQENYRIFNPKYDRNNNLIEGTIKIYSTANDCENDTNILAEYKITAQYTRMQMTGYKVIRIL